MILGSLIKAKVLAIVLASVAVVGGATAVLAATPAGEHAWQAVTGQADSTKTPDAHSDNKNNDKNCAGDATSKQMLASFSLSADAKSDAMQAVCELHSGQFKGKTPGGVDVSSTRVYGYGEIEKLLTYANYLATHDSDGHQSTGKLDDTNARAYLAEALQSCGSTPLEKCLMTNIPGYHPGNGDNGNGNNGDNGNADNGNGKPDGTPTPHH